MQRTHVGPVRYLLETLKQLPLQEIELIRVRSRRVVGEVVFEEVEAGLSLMLNPVKKLQGSKQRGTYSERIHRYKVA